MEFSEVINPLMQKTLKLLGLAAPLIVLAIVTIMVVQAYNEMANLDLGVSLETASFFVEIESEDQAQTAPLGR